MTVADTSFEHRQTAHCESGVVSALLRSAGMPLSEAMVFGIASGLTFAYLPFVRLGGLPLVSYRMPPQSIVRGVGRRLGVRMSFERFSDPAEGMRALDRHLDEGRIVGLQTSVYWLPYFPPDMRFHFNAHNLLVYGRDGDSYLISDPVFQHPVRCDAESLSRARFVRGALAPRGLLYYPTHVPREFPLASASSKSIRFTTGMMLHTPVPLIGLRGVRMVARRIARMRGTDETWNRRFLGHIVRMQEEIGTGGAGFRFLYAAFLQEAAALTGRPALEQLSLEMTAAGDAWRQFALTCARMCKDRAALDYAALSTLMLDCADRERELFTRLRRAVS